jgi:hypothetical protein
MNNLSDEDKKRIEDALNSHKEPSSLDNLKLKALQKLVSGLNTVDSYSGAPIRAGLAANFEAKDPNKYPIQSGFDAAKAQFGQDPSKAPTNEQVFQKSPLSSTPLSSYVPSLYNDPANYKNNSALDELKPEKGGALDVSPASAAGSLVGFETDPLMHVPIPGFSKLKGLIRK